MVKLTEDMIVARTRVSDLSSVKKLNCWGADLDDVSVLTRLENVEMLSLRYDLKAMPHSRLFAGIVQNKLI